MPPPPTVVVEGPTLVRPLINCEEISRDRNFQRALKSLDSVDPLATALVWGIKQIHASTNNRSLGEDRNRRKSVVRGAPV